MAQEHTNRRAVLVMQNDLSYGQRRAYTEEDEAWRSFLENPLTAATKAMMSVPREKRPTPPKTEAMGCDTDPAKRNHMVPFQEVAMAMTDSRLQVLRSVPFSMVAPGEQQHSRDKRDPLPLPDTTVTVSIAATAPTYPTKTEGTLNGFSGAPCARLNIQTLPIDGHLKHRHFSSNTQSHTPDSTFAESFKNGSHEVLSFPGDLQLQMDSVMPNENSPFHTVSSHNFEYTLEALKSLRQKSGGGPMTYLNKSQFYPISLRELGADYKGSFDTITNMEEIAYNAISFTWDTNEEARIYISVNCLSTDFSSQKGVKGLPLSLQIDTYTYSSGSSQPVHRACCQIKVFCDKGAERKVRDEERKQTRRKGKSIDASTNFGACECTYTTADGRVHPVHKNIHATAFKEMNDLETQPVLFVPEVYVSSIRHPYLSDDSEEGSDMKRLLFTTEDEFGSPPSKVARTDKPRKVLLYVRKETDEVFDALMLNTPTVSGLIEAISEKYKVPHEKVGKVYKRSKKGILVNMDDNIIQHYSNEDTFLIQLEEAGGMYKLTLTEI
ncbi:hypothetical protein JZ751_004933 [Albula glossodonta]|uniref:Grh/CP2 DB domain-containing protein n=1 Tax=Albula glossodonta TaxID=121402 RepID=A0A8T2P6T4_9TELE|nr:hypothetical protein JZ751_004933 [Albula glossodonta]